MMSMPAVPEYRVVLTADIEDYSQRTDAQQGAVQTALALLIDEAAEAAELRRQKWDVQVGGDSVSAVLPVGTDLSRLMDEFVRELDAGLGGYNRRRTGPAWTRLRIRLAVHAGPLRPDGATGWAGQHAVLPFRLRDSEPVRVALLEIPAADIALVISADVYRDYVTQGPGMPRPRDFRTITTMVKEKSFTGHLLVPGADLHHIEVLDKFDIPVPETSAAPQPGLGDTSDPSPAKSPRPIPKQSPGRSVGRDVIHGDRNTVTNGNLYQADRDMTVNHPPSRPRQ
jgi:hypothetical protein